MSDLQMVVIFCLQCLLFPSVCSEGVLMSIFVSCFKHNNFMTMKGVAIDTNSAIDMYISDLSVERSGFGLKDSPTGRQRQHVLEGYL